MIKDRKEAIYINNQRRTLRSELRKGLEARKPIALWRNSMRSNENSIHLQISDSICLLDTIKLEDLNSGFIFAPFELDSKKIFIPFSGETFTFQDISCPHKNDAININSIPRTYFSSSSLIHTSMSDFEHWVTIAKQHIANGNFRKVVLSKSSITKFPNELDLVDVFQKICNQHPNAFISLLAIPEIGIWMGASPEVLIEIKQNRFFTTMALAGTQPIQGDQDVVDVAWKQKEIEEQSLVSQYIIDCFKKIRLRDFEQFGPRTVQAGKLFHLRTDFTVDLKEVNFPALGTTMLNLLHPTSAICGQPLEPSLKFISKTENHNREFFSGYLGVVNMHHNTSLYVNLRCMKIHFEEAQIFAGAGITYGSTPHKEWLETEYKSDTMRKVLLP